MIGLMKPFLSIEDQINMLVDDKGLTIVDHERTQQYLKRIGYFGLVGGYKNAFKDSVTGKYRSGVTFDDIVALYKFDESLRELFLKYLLQVERGVRSLLSYYFTEKFGIEQEQYLNPTNYSTFPKHRALVVYLIKTLGALANKNTDYSYITYQRSKYGNVPLWVVINAITFGSLSKFYMLSNPKIQVDIAKNYPGVSSHQLAQFLSMLTKYRVNGQNVLLF
jgi:abortive infection bacteriophage resistance protein